MSSFDYIEEVCKGRYDTIVEVEKFNPYHDARGRFSTAGGATSFTYAPGKSRAHDLAIQREKERQAAMGGGTPKQGLVSGYGEKHAKAIEKLVQDNAPEEVRKMWDKYGDDIDVADAHYTKTPHFGKGGIYNDIDTDAAGMRTKSGKPAKEPYQNTIHESAHAVDALVSAKVGYDFATKHNNGKFESLLIKESNDYIKGHQKKLQDARGRKVSIDETRKELSMSLFAENDYLSTGMLSDILGGATKGKFQGTSGHAKQYWTGWKDYFGNVHAQHSVATEAFAHFTSTAANSKAAARLKSVFPESYKEYLSMCAYAASID